MKEIALGAIVLLMSFGSASAQDGFIVGGGADSALSGWADIGQVQVASAKLSCSDSHIQDLSYGSHELHKLDVYPSATENSPVIFFIHGGAWRTGDKSAPAHQQKGQYYSSQGYVFVSVNYRLSPEVQHPAHIQDVAAAFSYMKQNCRQWNGDPAAIYVMGHSAGAHLAALLSTNETYLEAEGASLSDISKTVLLDGAGYDIPLVKEMNANSFSRTYAPAFGTEDSVLIEASPIHNVEEGKGIASFLIIHIDREMSRRQSGNLANKLRECGYVATVREAEGKTHESLSKELGQDSDIPTQWTLKFFSGTNVEGSRKAGSRRRVRRKKGQRRKYYRKMARLISQLNGRLQEQSPRVED